MLDLLREHFRHAASLQSFIASHVQGYHGVEASYFLKTTLIGWNLQLELPFQPEPPQHQLGDVCA